MFLASDQAFLRVNPARRAPRWFPRDWRTFDGQRVWALGVSIGVLCALPLLVLLALIAWRFRTGQFVP